MDETGVVDEDGREDASGVCAGRLATGDRAPLGGPIAPTSTWQRTPGGVEQQGMSSSPRSSPSSPLAALSLLVLVMSLVGLARAWRTERPPVALREPRVVVDGPDARALRDGERLDLNRATAAELELLPRIGPSMARRIVEARPFANVDELVRVRGIGARTLERLRPLVQVGEPPRTSSTPQVEPRTVR